MLLTFGIDSATSAPPFSSRGTRSDATIIASAFCAATKLAGNRSPP